MARVRKFEFNADIPSFICVAALKVRKGTIGTPSSGQFCQLQLQVLGVISLNLQTYFVYLDVTS